MSQNVPEFLHSAVVIAFEKKREKGSAGTRPNQQANIDSKQDKKR